MCVCVCVCVCLWDRGNARVMGAGRLNGLSHTPLSDLPWAAGHHQTSRHFLLSNGFRGNQQGGSGHGTVWLAGKDSLIVPFVLRLWEKEGRFQERGNKGDKKTKYWEGMISDSTPTTITLLILNYVFIRNISIRSTHKKMHYSRLWNRSEDWD